MSDKDKTETVSYLAFESEMARKERTIKRLIFVIVFELIVILCIIAGVLIYESQFADEITTSTTIEADATDGGNAIINRDGKVNVNGARESQ